MNMPKLGSGERFRSLANKFAHKGIENPDALAAKIGREKFGVKKMTKIATAGKKRRKKEEEQ